MHPVQQKILQVSQQVDVYKMGLRQIAKLIGEDHPQKIKHHLLQLEKKGLIFRNKKTGEIKSTMFSRSKESKLFSLPILGSANAGPATVFAQENIEGFLRVSPGMVGTKNFKKLFILKVSGNSLNKARGINGGTAEDGDYVIIDGKNRNPRNGEYVLSIIDDMANLKRFYQDKKTGEISLLSESILNIPPIYIHPSDFSNYMINGVIIRVIKKPKSK